MNLFQYQSMVQLNYNNLLISSQFSLYCKFFDESMSTVDLWFKLIVYTNSNLREPKLLKVETAGATKNSPPVPTVKILANFLAL